MIVQTWNFVATLWAKRGTSEATASDGRVTVTSTLSAQKNCRPILNSVPNA
jgi:hypothetical protein